MNKITFLAALLLATPIFSMDSANPIFASHKDHTASLKALTMEQKIAQLMMIPVVVDEDMNTEFMKKSPYCMKQAYVENLITTYGIGNIIIMGKGTMQKAKSYIERLQGLSQSPLLIGIDAEWGLSMRLQDALRLPRAMTLGALRSRNDHLISKLATCIGNSCAELGIGINFAPVADANTNPENPIIGTRSFGEHPLRVAHKAALFAQGLSTAGVLSCAKHFPGHGDTKTDSHVSLPIILHDRNHLENVELAPFRHLIKNRIPAIMTAHLLVPSLHADMPASASKVIVTDLLQHELQFDGLIITDGLGMGALQRPHKPGEIELAAFLAGNDILLGVLDVPATIDRIKEAIQENKITENEINRRVLKVAQAKEWICSRALSARYTQNKSQAALINPVNFKKEIFRHAITLVKNNQNILPHPPETPVDILLCGAASPTKFTETLQHHIHTSGELPSTVLLAVYPKAPARMIDELNDQQQAPQCIAQQIAELRSRYKKIIAVLFDSPYRINEIADADGIICAYEDDPEAQYYAALALLGFFNPDGILPISAGDNFPDGTGLNYTGRP